MSSVPGRFGQSRERHLSSAVALLVFLAGILAPLASPAPSAAASSLSRPGCASPSSTQVRDDTDAVRRAAAAGVPLGISRQCLGFTLLVAGSVDPATAANYAEAAERSLARYSAAGAGTPTRRIGVYLFADATTRQRAFENLSAGHGHLSAGAEIANKAAGFEHDGDVWIDASSTESAGQPAHVTRSAQFALVAHEVSHAVTTSVSGGFPLPVWLNEGFAVYNEILLAADLAPDYAAWDAAQRRTVVLDTLAGRGARPLFALSELEGNDAWLANYAHAGHQSLQYAQSYEMVRWIIAYYGDESIWAMLRDLGRQPYDPRIAFQVAGNASAEQRQRAEAQALANRRAADAEALRAAANRALGASLDTAERAALAQWRQDLSLAPQALTVRLTVAASGIRADTWLSVRVRIDGTTRGFQAAISGPGNYELRVSPDGAITSPDGRLRLQPVRENELSEDGLSIQIGNAVVDPAAGSAAGGDRAGGDQAGGDQVVAYILRYGRWTPFQAGRAVFAAGTTAPLFLPGPSTEPFQDGNCIAVSVLG